MTQLKKVLKRELNSKTLRHNLIVQLDPEGIIRLKEKGSRRRYEIGIEALYWRLAKIEAKEPKGRRKNISQGRG